MTEKIGSTLCVVQGHNAMIHRVCVVTSVSCPIAFVPPIIDAGTPSDLPLEIDRENMNEKIGSTLHVVQGQSAMIQCSIFADTGLPIDSVDYTWYYMGMQITNGSKFMITVDDSRRSSTLMVNSFSSLYIVSSLSFPNLPILQSFD